MSKKDVFFLAVALPFLVLMLWVLKEAYGGWSNVAKLFGLMGVMMLIVGFFAISIMGTIYWLTIFRSRRYAEKLRAAGYAVRLHTHEVWQFAILALLSLIATPMAALLTQRVVSIYLCIQQGECFDQPAEWYVTALLLPAALWAVALFAVFGAAQIWFQSFRPLRRYYNDLRVGREPDLPRLR